MKDNLLKVLPYRARMYYRTALLSAFSTSIIIIALSRWPDANTSPSTLAFIAVFGLMVTLGSATKCIRLMLTDRKEESTGSAIKQ